MGDARIFLHSASRLKVVYALSGSDRQYNSTIPDLMSVKVPDRDLPWLKNSLQTAIALELSTIPPYLCAWWSIKDVDGDVAESIKTVWTEEMRHMGLACNLLAALDGGHPNLLSVIDYPSHLPGDVHPGLIAKLQGLTYDSLHLFMDIEKLDHEAHDQRKLSDGTPYPTIGRFYAAILEAFRHIKPTPTLCEKKQIKVSPGIFIVSDLDKVREAIDLKWTPFAGSKVASHKVESSGVSATPGRFGRRSPREFSTALQPIIGSPALPS